MDICTNGLECPTGSLCLLLEFAVKWLVVCRVDAVRHVEVVVSMPYHEGKRVRQRGGTLWKVFAVLALRGCKGRTL